MSAHAPDSDVSAESSVGGAECTLEPEGQLTQPSAVLDGDPDDRAERAGEPEVDRLRGGGPGCHMGGDPPDGLLGISLAEEGHRDVPTPGWLPTHIGRLRPGRQDRRSEGVHCRRVGPQGDEESCLHEVIIASGVPGGAVCRGASLTVAGIDCLYHPVNRRPT